MTGYTMGAWQVGLPETKSPPFVLVVYMPADLQAPLELVRAPCASNT